MYQHDRGYNFGRGSSFFVSSIKGVSFLLSSIRGGIIFEQVYTFTVIGTTVRLILEACEIKLFELITLDRQHKSPHRESHCAGKQNCNYVCPFVTLA